jgi:hypothetical protein
MSISTEQFEQMLVRHEHNMITLDLREDLIITLRRLNILDIEQYIDTMDRHHEEFDSYLTSWHEFKDDYYNNML